MSRSIAGRFFLLLLLIVAVLAAVEYWYISVAVVGAILLALLAVGLASRRKASRQDGG